MIATRQPRSGYTIFELILVMALLIILAAIIIPNTTTLSGDTRIKSAADVFRGELAAARAWSIQEGQPYRVAISEDGTKLRRAPELEFAEVPGSTQPASTARRVEVTFEKVTAVVMPTAEELPVSAIDGWVTVAVMMPDGTCRTADWGGNPTYTVALTEQGQTAAGLYITIRGLTGQVRVLTATQFQQEMAQP